MLGRLLPAELRRGWGQEDNVGLEVGLVDAGQGAGLKVEHADLTAVHHRPDAAQREKEIIRHIIQFYLLNFDE